jgi:hypothetical protein
MTNPSRTKLTIIIIAVLTILFVLPSLILSLEPNVKYGTFYYFLAKHRYEDGLLEEAEEFIELSLGYNPYFADAKKLEKEITRTNPAISNEN